ncbi:hypothetical protein BDV98DRAFT_591876 [Pterulicium gracile]|uniref:HNH nuclease domain-containing protein n=1 Tax=Pterulicium gracile TaxID=1884261 RepID=A0A5C3QM77_9AGAR|nr:hypothetical protein BDV98DRAFT_591876 [Pterula gracilis]
MRAFSTVLSLPTRSQALYSTDPSLSSSSTTAWGLIITSPEPWALFSKSDEGSMSPAGPPLQRDSTDVMPLGHFVLLLPGKPAVEDYIELKAERNRSRVLSRNNSCSPRRAPFVSRVRNRDGRCFINEELVDSSEDYFGDMCVSHTHPIAHADSWNRNGVERWILDDAFEAEQDPTKINSVQNGLLLRADVPAVWDHYLLGINVDDDYRILSFRRCVAGIGGGS